MSWQLCDSCVTSGSSWTPIFQKFYEILISLFDGKKRLKVFKVLQPGWKVAANLARLRLEELACHLEHRYRPTLVPALWRHKVNDVNVLNSFETCIIYIYIYVYMYIHIYIIYIYTCIYIYIYHHISGILHDRGMGMHGVSTDASTSLIAAIGEGQRVRIQSAMAFENQYNVYRLWRNLARTSWPLWAGHGSCVRMEGVAPKSRCPSFLSKSPL